MRKQELIDAINAFPESTKYQEGKINATTLKRVLKNVLEEEHSAYDIWLEQGNTGTLSDFLEDYQDNIILQQERSKLGGLLTNGSGHLKSNFNFSFATYDPLISDQGMGSFRMPPNYSFKLSDEFIPVNPNKVYRLSGSATTNQDGYDNNRKLYLGLVCYDKDKRVISAVTSMYYGRFTLTKPYVIGVDDFMYVDNVTNIDQFTGQTGFLHYRLGMHVWNYKSSDGYKYKYYTQHQLKTIIEDGTVAIPFEDGYKIPVKTSANGMTTNFSSVGETLPAGTELSVTNAGGTYKYIGLVNERPALYPQWSRVEGYIGGVDYTGRNVTHNFAPGTTYVKIMFITMRESGGENAAQWLADMNFVEVNDVFQQRVESGTTNNKYSRLEKVEVHPTTGEPYVKYKTREVKLSEDI